MKKLLAAGLSLSLIFNAAWAAQDAPASLSPVGYWKQISDKSNKIQSILQVYKDKQGEINGKVLVPIASAEGNAPLEECKDCDGKFKNAKLEDLEIMWGFKEEPGQSPDQGDGPAWSGGRILDPHGGSEYRCTIHTQNNGKELYVRGYVGLPFLGRTQVWHRISKQEAMKLKKQCGGQPKTPCWQKLDQL